MFKREISLIVCVVFCFSIILYRIGFIISTNEYAVQKSYSSYSITLDKLYPYLYYSNGGYATNNIDTFLAIIKPNEKCISELVKIFDYNERKKITDELRKGYPIVKEIDKEYDTKYIQIIKSKKTVNNLNQFINSSSSGMFSYVDDQIGYRKLDFGVDATGRMLRGDNGEIKEYNYSSKEGYILSIDSDIQDITYFACEVMRSGCAVVMDIATGDILASVTKPNDTYINKVIQQYSVGSVFKLIVTACALENNVDISYNCVGSILVGDTLYSCQKLKQHGNENLQSALANSCNCYFVKLILELGKEKILDTMNVFGFNDSTYLLDNWLIKNAVTPTNEDLLSAGQLAMLGFGQGALTATPLQICSSLCSIVNQKATHPRFIVGKVNYNGIRSYDNAKYGNNVITQQNSEKLLSYMRYVVSNGTGYYADDSANKSAGKTATAETGQYDNKRQLYNTWFAGVYPYDNPKYAIVIMCEDGNSGAEDCCPIFRTIVENINKL